jgi:ABC-type nitrate/sulfonate/bicarbonate transport system substrate-binding protein
MRRLSRHSAIALLIHLFVFHSQSLAQDKPLKKINWGVTSLSAGNWIPWVAKEAKIYEKHGLDVELILLRGSGQTSAALLGGSIFASPVALPTVMLADLSGADLVNVAHTVPGVQTKMLVKSLIKRPEDLRGKRVATSSLGSLGDFLLNTCCASMAWTRTEKLSGFPSARRPNGSRRCSQAPWTPPKPRIPLTCRRNAKDFEFFSMPGKR